MPENGGQNQILDSLSFVQINIANLTAQLAKFDQEIKKIDDPKLRAIFVDLLKRLQEELAKLEGQLSHNYDNGLALFQIIRNFRELMLEMQRDLNALTSPPLPYGYVARLFVEDQMVDIVMGNERRKVNVLSEIDVAKLKIGQRVTLAAANLAILSVDEEWEKIGQEAKVSALLDNGAARVITHLDETRDVMLAEPLREMKIREGDILLTSGYFAFSKLPKVEADELLLERVPEISFSQIGGLKNQIYTLLEAIEYPALYPELFKMHKLKPTKGILIYGPPGCGKTLLAKAVANRLAQKTREKIGKDNIWAYFINIKGPELLNKYVGETERKIREVFYRAKEKASEGCPVIIFFDEFESLFRTRGSGISSDVESTNVPQFLSMMDGVEELNNIVVIGASNRQDLIDPAVLRPGRFDLKVKVDRPDKIDAKEILKIYITSDLPWGEDSEGKQYVGQKNHSVIDRLHGGNRYMVDLSTPELVVEHMINVVVEYLYYDGRPVAWTDRRGNQLEYNTECIEITWADGEIKMLHIKDILVSGAMIESVISRVKKAAIRRAVTTGKQGIRMIDFYESIRDEIKESSDLPNTNNPDDWAKIIGQRSESGQRIVNVRPIIGTNKIVFPKKTEKVNTGQYL